MLILCHMTSTCVNMTKAIIDCTNDEKQIWHCSPCTKVRRKNIVVVSEVEDAKQVSVSDTFAWTSQWERETCAGIIQLIFCVGV